MERLFFGKIDSLGREAVRYFANFEGMTAGIMQAFRNLTPYMGAQRFRTPRGLDEIKQRAVVRREDPNATLAALQVVFESYSAMWTEGVWEIARARQSRTKFILSDNPVTFYCKKLFPSEWVYPNDPSLKQIGTRTIFPLALDSCLIISHLQFTRHPLGSPTEFRVNARFYDQAVKYLVGIQFGRELVEDEVIRINYILKKRATRYIAAAEEEWLYPEDNASTTDWEKLDEDWFLLPHLWKIPFTAEIVAGYDDGSVWATDEYGRRPGNPGFKENKQHERDWVTAQLAKQEWARKRLGKPVAHIDDGTHGDSTGDSVMRDYLRRQGLSTAATESLG
jgi:hypothetical protein